MENTRDVSGLSNKYRGVGSIWLPGGHANSVGRNKLTSIGKAINLPYLNNEKSIITLK